MRQVLFWIPIKTNLTPDGIPIYGFGMMLFVTFVVTTWVAGRRAQKEGIAKEHIQDLAIWIFIGGIVGARIVYMLQYGIPLWPPWNFFRIWEGGLVFYGSAIGGLAGYGLAYLFIIRKHGLSTWKMADIIAPAAAIGLCLGRLGCWFNGCCYGGVACPDCPGWGFPLSAPPRAALVEKGYQTAAGFTMKARDRDRDPRTIVDKVEPGSPAARSGLEAGDQVVNVDGLANKIVLQLKGRTDAVNRVMEALNTQRPLYSGETRKVFEDRAIEVQKLFYDSPQEYQQDLRKLEANGLFGVDLTVHDVLWDHLVSDWPRGKADLALTIKRNGDEIALPAFEPQTLRLHPTQLYESVSMGLLFLLLTAYYPFRRRDGEVMVLFMFGYAAHRFVNEMLRNDTDPVAFGMTLSQNGSVLVLIAALLLALWLWRRPVQYRPALA